MTKNFRTTAYIIISVSAVLGVCFSRLPLLAILGYESAAAIGLFAAIAGSALGIAAGRQTRLPEAASAPSAMYLINKKYLVCLVIGLAAIMIPFTIITGNTWLIKKCNLGPGVPLFFFITIPTLFHYTAAGLFLGRSRAKGRHADLLVAGYIILAALVTLLEALYGPRWVFNNLTVGMFSLSGYNGFEFIILPSFYVYRALTMFFSIFFIGLAILVTPEGRKRTPTDRFIGMRNVIVSLIVLLLCIIFVPDQTGIGFGMRTLDADLSKRYETENAVLHFSPETFNNKEVRLAGKYVEWYLYEIRDAMDMEQSWKVHIYFYADDDQMERHTGTRDICFAQPWKHALHITKRSSKNQIMKHELAHVMMGEHGGGLFGVPYNMGLVEGIATAIEENYFRGPKFQEEFAASLKAGVIASADSTISNTGFGATNMFKSYNMAGGFTGFILMEYGPAKLKEFYSGASAKSVYGKDLKGLNSEWTDWLGGVKVSEHALRLAGYQYDDTSFPAFYKKKCPRVGSRKEDSNPQEKYRKLVDDDMHREAAGLCEEIYTRVGDPKWLLRRGWRFSILKDYEKTLESAERALAAEKIDPYTKDGAYNQKAFALAMLERYDEATKTLEEKRSYGLSEPEKVEKLIRIVRRDKVRGILFPEYISRYGNVPGWMADKALDADPDFGLLYAEKAGAIYVDNGKNGEAALRAMQELIDTFVSLTEGLDELKISLLKKLGDGYLDAEMYDEAESAYSRMIPLAGNDKEKFVAERRLERVLFFRGDPE